VTIDQASIDELAHALPHGNFPTLVLVLAQLTGDRKWLAEPYRPSRGKPLDDNDTGGLSATARAEVVSALAGAIAKYRAGELVPAELAPNDVAAMLEVALGEDVPREYGPLLAEELGLASRDIDVPEPTDGFHVIVIGAGLSGLCAAIKLTEAGIPYTVIEKDTEVGGTWWENTYPGCGVDTPSHLYSFSFARRNWSRYFAKQPEVKEYLTELADEYGVREHLRLGTHVTRAAYQPDTATWAVTVDGPGGVETLRANVVISAVGMVNRPLVPNIPGLDSFEGRAVHTAKWDAEVELTGKRVGIVGTGASAMQVVPAVVDEVDRLVVFQRSKQWAVPYPNYHKPVSEAKRLLLEHVPFYASWYRLRAFWNFSDRLHSSLQIDPNWPHPDRSINEINDRHRRFLVKHITSELGDRTDLVDACVPSYPPYGKRPLLDNGWYRAIAKPNVDFVPEAVAEVRPHSVVSTSGDEYPVDVLVLATGFEILHFLASIDVIGASGRSLRQMWGRDDARAYLGITVPDFPNFFVLNGPNTNAGHGGSAVISTELQMRYVMQAVKLLVDGSVSSVEVTDEAFWDYNNRLDDALSRCIWVHPGMTTYHRNDAGRVVVSSPWKYVDYWRYTLEFDVANYIVLPSAQAPGETEDAVA